MKTEHEVEGVKIEVETEKTSVYPPVFKIRAAHPNGTFHEHVLTLGDADLNKITNLKEAQKTLDAARQNAAVLAYKKSILSDLVARIN